MSTTTSRLDAIRNAFAFPAKPTVLPQLECERAWLRPYRIGNATCVRMVTLARPINTGVPVLLISDVSLIAGTTNTLYAHQDHIYADRVRADYFTAQIEANIRGCEEVAWDSIDDAARDLLVKLRAERATQTVSIASTFSGSPFVAAIAV